MSWIKERMQEASTLNGVGGVAVILLLLLGFAFLARVFNVSLVDIFSDAALAVGALGTLVVAAFGLIARVKQITTPEPSAQVRQANVEDVKQAIAEVQHDTESSS